MASFINQKLIACKFSQAYVKLFLNSYDSKSLLIFSLALVVVDFLKQFCEISLNKSCKAYLGTMPPPGGRNWQVISPHCSGQAQNRAAMVARFSQ